MFTAHSPAGSEVQAAKKSDCSTTKAADTIAAVSRRLTVARNCPTSIQETTHEPAATVKM